MRKILVAGLVCLSVSACAGRKAMPVSVVQADDDKLSCQQIQSEETGNEARALQLGQQNSSAHNNNIALGVVGAVLFWPALFAIDTGDAEKVEIQALHSRNEHLTSVAKLEGCDATKSATTVPAATPAPTANGATAQASDQSAPKSACKLADGSIVVKTEADCKAAGGLPAPF
jgi:hypothetical protein